MYTRREFGRIAAAALPAASLLAAVVFLTTAAGAQSGRAARPAGARKRTRDARSRARTTPRAAASMPVLRQPHDHHRDLRARLRAEVPPHTAGSNQDRHVRWADRLIYLKIVSETRAQLTFGRQRYVQTIER